MTSTLTSNIGGDSLKMLQTESLALPQSTSSALFTVSDSDIIVVGLIGVVTTAIQNQANSAKLFVDFGGGGPDITTALDIANDAEDTFYTVTGVQTDAFQEGGLNMAEVPFVVPSGSSLSLDCTASNTGEVQWILYYQTPNEEGVTATVVAAT
jgi:hypothetical protein